MSEDTTPIEHTEKDGSGRYFMRVDGGEAELTYSFRDDDVMVIDHTFTPPEARGQSLARKLTERAVADARERKVLIEPVCPYVAKLFDRKPEWAALRA